MQISANGITLYAETHGPENGVPMVLIRGLGSQIVHWAPELISGFVAAGFRVITFDNRDAGLSARCPAPGATGDPQVILDELRAGRPLTPAYALSDMARDVVGLLDALGLDRAHVFGISMGGAITQILAMEHAQRLLSATIVMSSARLRDPALVEQLLSRPLDRETFVEAALYGDRIWGSPGYPAPEAYFRSQHAAAFDRGAEADAMNRQLLAIVTSPERRERLKTVSLPCLVIHGADDTLIGPDEGREIAALIPGAELEVIDGMGHIITPALAPVIVARVERFIHGRS